MPIIVPKDDVDESEKWGKKMSKEFELMTTCGWGKCTKRLERVLKKKPNVNYKNEDGMTPLHVACSVGAGGMVKMLLDAKADPNVPATAMLYTPLDMVVEKIGVEEEKDARLNNFDTVMRLDDSTVAIRPDLKGYYECKKYLEEGGGVLSLIHTDKPNITPDGSVNGGKPSELRAYDKSEDGTYSIAYHLRSGKYDLVTYQDGMLVEAAFDPTTGKWESDLAITA
mmetsp:Transcript_3233/g.5230  ORF Transcript_3233/g.5230 Transcript_3233/m.5230 type:complete len:225 (+) Transcript_3233:91-765(+)